LSDDYFESLGEPKPGTPFGLLDSYRFDVVYRSLTPGNVLDVGVYFGDFLKIAQKDGRKIFGTEINEKRVNLANSILKEEIVVLNFRNGRLDKFRDSSVDNVVCMEAVEHVPDDLVAVSELCRVARTRVVITVPFQENIQNVLCLHCYKYTPYSGHLHSYDRESFYTMVPPGWQVTKTLVFAKRVTRIIGSRLPKSNFLIPFLRLLDRTSPGKGIWLMVVLQAIE
ncbi:class I SAM-dependent methyltransferase, partial [Chloroflexota bacterium]